jgi:oligoribonuclease
MEFLITKCGLKPGNCPIAGNSVHTDRKFISKDMPRFHEFLSPKIIDVTTFKHLCKRWNPMRFKNLPKKEKKHTAIDDIHESIEEMLYYK